MREVVDSVFAGRSFRGFFVAVALLNIVGCGGGDVADDKYKGARGTVHGKITYKGSPVPAGTLVQFQAAGTDKGGAYQAIGTVNERGEYQLVYTGHSGGMPAVNYVVSLTPPASKPAGGVNTAEMKKMETVGAAPMDPSKFAAPQAALPFPEKYTLQSTSGLEHTVVAGRQEKNFELTD